MQSSDRHVQDDRLIRSGAALRAKLQRVSSMFCWNIGMSSQLSNHSRGMYRIITVCVVWKPTTRRLTHSVILLSSTIRLAGRTGDRNIYNDALSYKRQHISVAFYAKTPF